jgi:hypothetical protein
MEIERVGKNSWWLQELDVDEWLLQVYIDIHWSVVVLILFL